VTARREVVGVVATEVDGVAERTVVVVLEVAVDERPAWRFVEGVELDGAVEGVAEASAVLETCPSPAWTSVAAESVGAGAKVARPATRPTVAVAAAPAATRRARAAGWRRPRVVRSWMSMARVSRSNVKKG
jgi:hypothetical protein